MLEQLTRIRESALERLKGVKTEEELEELNTEILGRNGAYRDPPQHGKAVAGRTRGAWQVCKCCQAGFDRGYRTAQIGDCRAHGEHKERAGDH